MIAYTAGGWDLFHVGHLRLLQRVRRICDKNGWFLIVGVSTDELVKEKGNNRPVIPFSERWEILESINIADQLVMQPTFDKHEMQKRIGFDVLFVGSDHYPDFDKYKDTMKVVYLPYGEHNSTTKIIKQIHG